MASFRDPSRGDPGTGADRIRAALGQKAIGPMGRSTPIRSRREAGAVVEKEFDPSRQGPPSELPLSRPQIGSIQLGGRFSKKAPIPSRASSVALTSAMSRAV